MELEVEEQISSEQLPSQRGRSAWGLGAGALFVLVFFFVLSGRVYAKPYLYWGALLFALVILAVIWGRIYWQSPGRLLPPRKGEYLVGLVVIVAPLALCSAVSSIRAAHLLLPKEERVMSFVVTGRGTYSSLKRKGCFHFSELPGFFNDSVCGYSRYFLAMVRVGDVFSYRAVVSPIGFQLKEVVEVKRDGSLVYRRKAY